MSENPRVALVGPGAIGTTIAAALHEVGRTPTVCGRTAYPQLVLRYDEGRIVVPGPVLTDPTAIKQPFDLVFVAVKATQLSDSAGWLAALCDEKTVVCALQNGVEQKAQITPYVSGATVLPSVVWFPALREPDASVWLRAKPRLTLPDTPQSDLVLAALQDTRCEVDVAADFHSTAWSKLLQNAVGGLMALSGRRVGMFRRDDISELGLAYLRECLAVARAEGANLGDELPQEIVDQFHQLPPDLATSIQVDKQAGRPMEWDIRNGVIQRYGRKHGIATPISDIIVPLLAAGSDGPG
ncbi:oxidoreductase [Kosakonia sp. H02]|nr:oxidoreductase [Kosakonia sp. H02]